MTVKAISFDLFDTLVDIHMDRLPVVEIDGQKVSAAHRDLHALVATHAELDVATFARTLSEVDARLRDEFYANDLELPTLVRFQTLTRELQIDDPSLPHALTDTYMQCLFEQMEVVPHHATVLHELAERTPLGICSNFSHTATARRALEHAGLLPHLSGVTISEDVGLRKPRREIFEAMLTALRVDATETVHVGDNLDADVQGAAELGMRTVWINRRIPDPEAALREYAGARPTWSITDLAELPGILECA